jgi:hypothetical protein
MDTWFKLYGGNPFGNPFGEVRCQSILSQMVHTAFAARAWRLGRGHQCFNYHQAMGCACR